MKATKKARKLLKGANAAVKRSMKASVIGDYAGHNPIYSNMAKMGQPDNFVKVASGIPFVRPSLHGYF